MCRHRLYIPSIDQTVSSILQFGFEEEEVLAMLRQGLLEMTRPPAQRLLTMSNGWCVGLYGLEAAHGYTLVVCVHPEWQQWRVEVWDTWVLLAASGYVEEGPQEMPA